ncbi:DUF6242 domain-containing protein [Bacteroides congonensis]|uniref:DUF6242 domain-containing protein n=1 Tax=Bacteroides congonensis TaxID=1871006 RepID=UPI00189D2BE0|nr:DUF6242 domain-containing protein [Bacteroides congonensis]
MRIKFLSFIASFFMVSFVITSCLDDDNNIEYSPDATIHAFALDTIGYGITYKFTIDQQKGEIYNEDSLPVHADTIIDKILIKTLTTASGVITMKNKANEDSIINISDSIDLRNPIKIKVWSTEGLAEMNDSKTKEYTITVRVHKHDPDSLKWKYNNEINDQIDGEQKSVILGSEVFTYSVVDGQLNVYKNSLTNFGEWSTEEVKGLPEGKLPTSILTFQFDRAKKQLYATSDDGKVYESANGINWIVSSTFGDDVELLLATLSNNNVSRISYIKKENGQRYFYYQTNDKAIETLDEAEDGGKVPENFPTKNISYTVYTTSTNINSVLLVGDTDIETSADDSNQETTTIWTYDGEKWIDFSTTSSIASCPKFIQPSIIYYNGLVYIFGQEFKSIYASEQGLFWRKASPKFTFPYRDWSKEGIGEPTPQIDPEFRGRTKYSMVLDYESQNIWIIFSKGTATFEEEVEDEEDTTRATKTHSYPYGSEVWSGRLNQLWFDLDPEHAGQ